MSETGALFYDNPAVFSIYQERREQSSSANQTLEWPIIEEWLAQRSYPQVLDLGCGDAAIAPWLLKQGTQHYHGLDGSARMIELASALRTPQLHLQQAYIENWEYPEIPTFDLVLSRLAFHYIEDIQPVFQKIFRALKPGGDFVFSVEHPVITSNQLSLKQGANRQDWVVDRYFQTGKRNVSWMGRQVLKYHRTVEDYYQSLKQNGFMIQDLRESCPKATQIKDKKLFEKRSRIPLFLLLSARKP